MIIINPNPNIQNNNISLLDESDINNPNTPSIMLNSFKYNYYGTIQLFSNLLNKYDLDKSTENRIAITEKMFEHLLANPNILIYQPKFRAIVVNKLNDIQLIIQSHKKAFEIAKYNEAFSLVKKSLNSHITNSTMLKKINSKLDKVISLIDTYNSYVSNTSLTTTINSMRTLLEVIKKSPDYVHDLRTVHQ